MTTTKDLIDTLAADTTPQRSAPHPFILGAQWLAVGVAYLLLTLVVLGLRPDLTAKLQSPLFLAELVSLASIIVTTALAAALLSFPDLHQQRQVLYWPAWAFAVFVGVMGLSWRADNPAAPLPAHDLECLLCIAAITLLPAAGILYAMRQLASTHPYTAGSIAVLCAFSLGALSLRLSEQTDAIIHVLQWHYLPMIGVAIIGLGLGKLLLKW